MSEYLPPVGVEPPSWQEIAEAMARGRDEARRELTEAEASHQAEIARLQSLNAMLGANVDALDAEVGRLRADLGDLAERFDKQGAHFVRLTNEVVDLRAERDTLAARLAEAEKVRDDVLALARYCELGARDDVYLAATRVLHAYRSTRAEATDG